MGSKLVRALFASRDRGIRDYLEVILERWGYAFASVESLDELDAELRQRPYDVIFFGLVDDAERLIATAARIRHDSPEVVLVDAWKDAAIERAILPRIEPFLSRRLGMPFDIQALEEVLAMAPEPESAALIDRGYEDWFNGSAVAVAHQLLGPLDDEQLATRAVEVLDTCRAYVPHGGDIVRLVEVGRSPREWERSGALFDAIRRQLLEAEDAERRGVEAPRGHRELFHVASSAADAICLAIGAPRTDGEHDHFTLSINARSLARSLGDAAAAAAVWGALSGSKV